MRGRDQIIWVQQYKDTLRNHLNEPIGVWVARCRIWASRRDVGDAEKLAGDATGSALTAHFVVRDNHETRAILPAMRVWDGERAWNIKSVLQRAHNGRRDLITIVAVADSTGGTA